MAILKVSIVRSKDRWNQFFFWPYYIFRYTRLARVSIIQDHRQPPGEKILEYSILLHFTEELTGPFWKRATQKRKGPLPFVYRASWPIVYKKLHRKLDVKVARLMRFLTCNDFASQEKRLGFGFDIRNSRSGFLYIINHNLRYVNVFPKIFSNYKINRNSKSLRRLFFLNVQFIIFSLISWNENNLCNTKKKIFFNNLQNWKIQCYISIIGYYISFSEISFK